MLLNASHEKLVESDSAAFSKKSHELTKWYIFLSIKLITDSQHLTHFQQNQIKVSQKVPRAGLISMSYQVPHKTFPSTFVK